MDAYDLRPETKEERDKASIINDHREYIIKIDEKNKYLLRLELKQKIFNSLFLQKNKWVIIIKLLWIYQQ